MKFDNAALFKVFETAANGFWLHTQIFGQINAAHRDHHGVPTLALHAFRANPDSYDMVVTDMMMPEMNGVELIAALRDIRADLPAMMISSYIAQNTSVDSLEDVVKVSKQVNMNGLAYALRQTIDHKPT